MKKFLDKDFLLETPAAKKLYHEYAAKMPIIDYHCHINPRDIAEDKRYSTITEVWLGGDHYKWRQMRTCGFQETDITGAKDSDPFRTFEAWAKTLPNLIGNPLYHWTYLELKNYFGVTEQLDASSAKRIYAKCNKVLAKKSMSVRGIIDKSKVKLICTTDDPVDTLEWHDKIAADKKCKVKVLPAFRPDKAFNVDKKPFANYIKALEKVVGFKIAKFSDLLKALGERIEFFASKGCKVSDHGLDYAVYQEASQKELDAILAAGLKGKAIDIADGDKFRTAVLVYLAQEYAKRDWVMQLHYGCIRDNSSKMMEALGPDTGFDAVGDTRGAKALANLLDAFERKGTMPKVVLYSLNQNDNEIMGTVAGCFQTNGTFPQRIQIGSAWWFNDHKSGMEKQLKDFANLSALAGFVGMLTDSRSFLSYARHEYFRRILCNVIGKWVDNGEVIADFKTLGKIVQDISFNNTNNYFGFGVK